MSDADDTEENIIEQVENPKVRCLDGGPYLVYRCEVNKVDGSVVSTEGNIPLALCACGKSSNKPFCDGTHSK